MNMFLDLILGTDSQYNSYREIMNAARNAMGAGKSPKEVGSILKEAFKMPGKPKADDFELINAIASLLAGPNLNDIKSALKLWGRILRTDPLNFEALFYSTGYWIASGKKKDALRACGSLIGSDRKKGMENIKRAFDSIKRDGVPSTKQSIEGIASDLYGKAGKFLFVNKRYDQAISAYTIAYELDKTNYAMIIDVASVLFHQKRDYAAALSLYKKCLEAMVAVKADNKDHIEECEHKIAECLYLLGKVDEAKEVIRKFIMRRLNYSGEKLDGLVEITLKGIKRKHNKR